MNITVDNKLVQNFPPDAHILFTGYEDSRVGVVFRENEGTVEVFKKATFARGELLALDSGESEVQGSLGFPAVLVLFVAEEVVLDVEKTDVKLLFGSRVLCCVSLKCDSVCFFEVFGNFLP